MKAWPRMISQPTIKEAHPKLHMTFIIWVVQCQARQVAFINGTDKENVVKSPNNLTLEMMHHSSLMNDFQSSTIFAVLKFKSHMEKVDLLIWMQLKDIRQE